MWKEAQEKILGCGVVLCVSTVLLFLNNQIGDFLASSRSLLFLPLIGLPLVLQIATGKVDSASVGRCCIPAGIFVSCLNTIILMGNLASFTTIISSIKTPSHLESLALFTRMFSRFLENLIFLTRLTPRIFFGFLLSRPSFF